MNKWLIFSAKLVVAVGAIVVADLNLAGTAKQIVEIAIVVASLLVKSPSQNS